MSNTSDDEVVFDEAVALALAELSAGPAPRPLVKAQLMARLSVVEPLPAGFSVRLDAEEDWIPHPVPGIRMKVLSINPKSGYATLLLDVKPGSIFPAHHHDGDEECFVLSGDVITFERRLGPGDFIHADSGTDHTPLRTETGARVILIVPREEYMPLQTEPRQNA